MTEARCDMTFATLALSFLHILQQASGSLCGDLAGLRQNKEIEECVRKHLWRPKSTHAKLTSIMSFVKHR